jgi:hypothetical protein
MVKARTQVLRVRRQLSGGWLRKILTGLLGMPLAGVILLFAVANRHWVTVSFDPLAPERPALATRVPLFLAILLALILGVIVGGIATWVGQAKWRAAARGTFAELRRLRVETDALKRDLEAPGASAPSPTSLTPLVHRLPPTA